MAGGNKEKKESESIKKTPKEVEDDFVLNSKYYEESDGKTVYRTEKRIARVFGAKNKKTGEKFIRIISKSKKPWGWYQNYGVDFFNASDIKNLFIRLRNISRKFMWGDIESNDIENLKKELRKREESINELEQQNKEEREKHEEVMEKFRKKQEEILKSKTKDFQEDTKELESLIKKAEKEDVLEEVLQTFLYEHSWLFGSEYINAEPQKLRGAHSKFDFYLERFNKTNDIVEIKKPSDPIINQDGSISAKVIQAVDQLIEYMESSIAAAHSSVISDEEGIKELRPRGIVIIGMDRSKEATQKLFKWNYQFAHIRVQTYRDVLEGAKSLLKHIKD